MKTLRRQQDQKGSALITMIIIIPFLILITALFMELALNSLSVAGKDQASTHAQLASDAGIDYALQILNQDSTWTTTGGEVLLRNEGNVRTTYDVTLVDNSSTSRTLTSVGRTYRPAASTTPSAIKTIKAELRPIGSAGYSVVTGVGGLFMTNSAKIVGGDVLVNGEITMQNSTQIGLSTNPVKVEVAHQNCPVPADANYPRLCASGENGEPITIQNEAHIFADVKANNQISGSGMSSPGLTASSGIAAQALPVHDRSAQITAVSQTINAADASCQVNGGTRTWAANTKIVGDVKVSKSCKVTIGGNIWITGKLEMTNSAQLVVSDALTTTMPDIMVDGTRASFTNSSAIISNSSNTGARLVTYWSKAACSPDCANVTGLDLYSSRNDETITMSNTASAPQSTFYAKWTRVHVSNSGGIGALIGQTVELSNSATITFGSTAATGTTFWVLDGYRRAF